MPLGATSLRRHSLRATADPILRRYENGTSSQPLHGLRSTLSDPANAIQRSSYPASAHYLPRSLPNGVYTTYVQTPRIVNSTTLSSFSPGPALYMADGTGTHNNMARQPNESHDFKFPTLECAAEIKCNEQALTPEIHAKVEKGLFLSIADRVWTCYRRNYFSVNVSFELHCDSTNGLLYVKNRNKDEQVQAMGMRLSAAVDGNGGKTIELIQHTPKRDNGPKTKIEITKVSPTPSTGRTDTMSPDQVYHVPIGTFHSTGMVAGPYLPLQNTPERGSDLSDPSNGHQPCHASMSMQYGGGNCQMGAPSSTTQYTFERIQFKQATANNGKRRASQQFFHLIVELFADVRKGALDEPKWIKVAHRTSEKIVVRGRSPSHYQNEGQGHADRGGSANGGGYGGGSIGYGGVNGASYPNGYRPSLGSNAGPGASNYTYHATDGRGSSSPESDMGDALDAGHAGSAQLVPEAGRNVLSTGPGYRYHPAPLYDEYRPQLPKIETNGTLSTEPRQYAFKSELPDAVPGAQWQANPLAGANRFQGFPSSHGWYPQPAGASASDCS